jgi:hypothetical protein
MREMIEQEIAKDVQYLTVEGDNEQDRSFYEGRIEALKWVARKLEGEAE